MKLKTSLIAVMTASMFAAAALGGCGDSGSNSAAPVVPVESPAALTKTDTAIGTGAEASAGKTVKVHYTGYLYSTSAPGNKGVQFDSSVGRTPLSFKVGNNDVVAGFDQGVAGMKVGGKRTVLIPASLGYGASGSGRVIPPNAGLVFDVELVEVI